MSINYLRAQARTLELELLGTPIGGVKWQNLQNQLLVVRAQLRTAEGAIQGLTF
jgi:hypothetical protein